MDLVEFSSTVYPQVKIDCGERALAQVVSACRQLVLQVGRNVKAGEICEDVILSHMRWMKDRGCSTHTINRRRGHLLTVWKVAYKRGYNRHDYWKADVPKVKNTTLKPVAWSVEDIETMLRQTDEVKVSKDRPFTPECWKSLILLIYYTGLRIECVLKLKRSNLHGRVLMVPPSIQKDKEEQVFRIPGDLANMLIALPRPHVEFLGRMLSEMLIPWPWRFDSASKMFKKYIIVPAGLPDDRRLKFHAIRKTVATVIAAHRGPEEARRALGHSCLSVTKRYLADPSTVDPSLPGDLNPQDVLPRIGAG